ncbi:MAG: hypothetical protein ACLQOO_11250 [Terriglobia bacterium]
MAKKSWYNYFLTVDEAQAGQAEEAGRAERDGPAEAGHAAASPRSAAQTVAEIASGLKTEPKFTGPVANPTSFDEIYAAAEINPPTSGFTILKIIDLLQSEHIRNLSRDVKRSSLLLALEAAGVKAQEVVQDAVMRDKALDTYESVQQKALAELEAKKTQETKELQAEIERQINEMQSRIQANNDAVAKEKERFYGWQLKKQQEEQKIGDAVSYFTSETPGTTAPAPSTKAAEKH